MRRNTESLSCFGDRFCISPAAASTSRDRPDAARASSGRARSSCSAPVIDRQFVIDTVFVTGPRWIDHSSADYLEVLDGAISPEYRESTIDPWYWGEIPASQRHRLYFGANRRGGPVPGDASASSPCALRTG